MSQSVSQSVNRLVCNFVRSLVIQIILSGTSFSALMGTAECAKRFESAAPCLPGLRGVLNSAHGLPYGNLPVLELSPSGPAHSARHLRVRSYLGQTFAPKPPPKSIGILICVLMPSGSDFGWFWEPQGSKMDPRWSQIPFQNGVGRRSLKRTSFRTIFRRNFNKKH